MVFYTIVWKLQNHKPYKCISIVNSENHCKYYKITDITNNSHIYVLVCQSNAERKLQNYKPYKHLYNQHIKKQINYNLTNITKTHGRKIVCMVFYTIVWKLQNYKPYNV